jgi:catechol 2,3-dioxygenase-like lactoylglutathione lyase family enzyme
MSAQPQTIRTGHVGINVTDVPRSTGFYQRVLGLQVQAERHDAGQHWAFLGREGTLVLTLWQQAEGAFSTSLPGLHHLSFQVDTLDEVREVEAALRAEGAEFVYQGVVPHSEGSDSGGVFFRDPDGIRLEVFAPHGAGSAPAPTPGAPSCGFF